MEKITVGRKGDPGAEYIGRGSSLGNPFGNTPQRSLKQSILELDNHTKLENLNRRAETLVGAASRACQLEKWVAYKWLIREYRRKRLTWETLADIEGIPAEEKSEIWGTPPAHYARDIDVCRMAFGLQPQVSALPALPRTEERKETYINTLNQEFEEDRKKYDPYYRPN